VKYVIKHQPAEKSPTNSFDIVANFSSVTLKRAKKGADGQQNSFELHIKEPLTFMSQLQKSPILSQIQTESHADQFLDHGAKHLENFNNKNDAAPKNDDQINWNAAMEIIKEAENIYPGHEIDKLDLMDRPGIRPTHNLASIVNVTPTLQRLVDLGTNIAKWEENGFLDLALQIDFQNDVAPRYSSD
jgi:hypothetical protein